MENKCKHCGTIDCSSKHERSIIENIFEAIKKLDNNQKFMMGLIEEMRLGSHNKNYRKVRE